MPYKVVGKNIMHMKGGKWKIKQKMMSAKDAYGIMSKLNKIDKGERLFPDSKKKGR